MTRDQILTLIDDQLSWNKSEGDFRKKATVQQTCHVGKITGNRLNSGTARSQLIFCESLADWTGSDARKALHIDQRAFVQVGDDVWNVFRGVDLSERNEPVLWKENVRGLESFLSDRSNLQLAWQKSTDYESLFVDWLREFYVAKTGKLLATVMVDRYYDCLKKLHQSPEFAGAGFPSVFSVRTLARWNRMDAQIRAHAGFVTYNTPNSGAASVALSKYSEFLADRDIVEIIQKRFFDMKLQKIVYGAPGTGKSFGTDDKLKDSNGNPNAVVFRTTFHPDSDYSSFVGAYKPMMNGDKIGYDFRPQAFMDAYVTAWRKLADRGGDNLPVALVIEEINRGNCAQIFGDLFQLLDRDDKEGYSVYPIVADVDLRAWLKKADQFGATGLQGITKPDCIRKPEWDLIVKGEMLALPPNLYIWATMNTSDQSLFPIDSAFKRRWDWEYVPIAKPDKDGDATWKDRKIVADGELFDWWDFISIVNEHISDITKSEDKQMGYFFVKAPDATGHIMADRFANKVLFYLFFDVFKDWDLPEAIFGTGNGKDKFAFKDFFYAEKAKIGNDEFKPGDVKEKVVAKFIEHLRNKKGDGVAKEPLNQSTAPANPPAAPANPPANPAVP